MNNKYIYDKCNSFKLKEKNSLLENFSVPIEATEKEQSDKNLKTNISPWILISRLYQHVNMSCNLLKYALYVVGLVFIYLMLISQEEIRSTSTVTDEFSSRKVVDQYLVNTSKCHIPSLNPWNPDTTPLYIKRSYIQCSTKEVDEDVKAQYSASKIYCCYSNISRGAGKLFGAQIRLAQDTIWMSFHRLEAIGAKALLLEVMTMNNNTIVKKNETTELLEVMTMNNNTIVKKNETTESTKTASNSAEAKVIKHFNTVTKKAKITENESKVIYRITKKAKITENESKVIYRTYVKPNGNIENVTDDIHSKIKDFGRDDYVFIQCGTNDISHCYDSTGISKILDSFANIMQITNCTNAIVCTLPFRFDKPEFNAMIEHVNLKLYSMSKNYSHLELFTINNILLPRYYTYYGLHLNNLGKDVVCRYLKDYFIEDSPPMPEESTILSNSGETPFTNNTCLQRKAQDKKPRLQITPACNGRHRITVMTVTLRETPLEKTKIF
ncbi:hypothetical protein QE152_g29926 [Popillia japonica]|uniref:SGNH hydrolase-type esterase domain-containing protein n=1 Tax=Popillia japonica TaxID=7064 RepID=A0AAW1JGL6_POPJA